MTFSFRDRLSKTTKTAPPPAPKFAPPKRRLSNGGSTVGHQNNNNSNLPNRTTNAVANANANSRHFQDLYRRTKSELEQMKQRNKHQQTQLDLFNRQRVAFQSNNAYQEKIRVLTQSNELLRDKQLIFQQTKDSLSAELAEYQHNNHEIQEQLAVTTADLEAKDLELTQHSQSVQRRLSKWEKRYESLKSEYADLSNEYLALTKASALTVEELNAMSKHYREVKDTHAEMKHKYETMSDEYHELQLNFEDTQIEISQTREESDIAVRLAQKKDKNIIKDLRQSLKSEAVKSMKFKAEYLRLKDELNDLREWRQNYLKSQLKMNVRHGEGSDDSNHNEEGRDQSNPNQNQNQNQNQSGDGNTSEHSGSNTNTVNTIDLLDDNRSVTSNGSSKSNASSSISGIKLRMKGLYSKARRGSLSAISSLPSLNDVILKEFTANANANASTNTNNANPKHIIIDHANVENTMNDDECKDTEAPVLSSETDINNNNTQLATKAQTQSQPLMVVSTKEYDEVIAALSDRLAIVKENYMNLKNIVGQKDENIVKLQFELEKKKEMVADLIEKLNEKPLPPTPRQLAKLEAAEQEFYDSSLPRVKCDEDQVLVNLEAQGLSDPFNPRKPSANSQALLAMHNIGDGSPSPTHPPHSRDIDSNNNGAHMNRNRDMNHNNGQMAQQIEMNQMPHEFSYRRRPPQSQPPPLPQNSSRNQATNVSMSLSPPYVKHNYSGHNFNNSGKTLMSNDNNDNIESNENDSLLISVSDDDNMIIVSPNSDTNESMPFLHSTEQNNTTDIEVHFDGI